MLNGIENTNIYLCIFYRNTLRPKQNGRHFADDIFKCIFVNENLWMLIKISLKFVAKGPINSIPALVQIMAWCRPGDKLLSESMMVNLMTHICVTQPQWVDFQMAPIVELFSHGRQWPVYHTNSIPRKWIWKCPMQNIHHSIQAPVC